MLELFRYRSAIRAFALCAVSCTVAAGASERYGIFEADNPSLDTDGRRIQAHGGGILRHGHLYYWFGENMDAPTDPRSKNVPLTGVSCYSSRDLRRWKNEGLALAAVRDDPEHDLAPANVAERPKVIYNRKTRKFVMWLHVDKNVDDGHGHFGYEYARAGVAVADNPTGPYRYIGSIRPDGQESRDLTVFQDDDGSAYLIFASKRNSTMHFSLLTPDYLRPSGQSTEITSKGFCEAPAMLRSGNRYFLLASACTGWKPNPALYAVADSPLGPWTVKDNPCKGPDAAVTFRAQGTYVLPVPGKRGAFLFLADRWNPDDLRNSRTLWLPLRVIGDRIEIRWFDRWDFSVFDRPWL